MAPPLASFVSSSYVAKSASGPPDGSAAGDHGDSPRRVSASGARDIFSLPTSVFDFGARGSRVAGTLVNQVALAMAGKKKLRGFLGCLMS